jgi:DNA-binding transcriptional LysR family regulator
MQIQHLKHLMALAEHRTLSRSARALGISQAALSKSVRRLEAYLEVPLFERTAQGLIQTEYGRALIEQARLVLIQMAETERTIRTLRNGVAGRIAIGAAVSVIESVVARTIAWLLARQETLDIHIVEGMHDQLFDYLRKGDIDVVLANLVQDDTAADLVQELLYYDDVVVVARPGHPLSRLPRVEPADIAKYKWVMTGVSNVARRQLERRLAEQGLPQPRVAIESASLSFEREILMRTDLLGYMSTIALQPTHSCSTLVPLHAEWMRWQRPVGIITRVGTALSPACRKFLGQLRRQVPAHVEVNGALPSSSPSRAKL